MSNQSSTSPAGAASEFRYISPVLLHYAAETDTMYVGASRTAFRGDRLEALSEVDPAVTLATLKNRGNQFDIESPGFRTMVKQTWMGLSDATKSQFKANEKSGYDKFTEVLRQKFERLANNLESRPPLCAELNDCELDLVAPCTPFPFGTVGTTIPVEPAEVGTDAKASVALEWDDEDTPTQLQNIRFNVPCSFYIQTEIGTGPTKRFAKIAMTPTGKSWRSVVRRTLLPLKKHCETVLQPLMGAPTDTKAATAQESIASLGEFLTKREMMFYSHARDLRAQRENEQLTDGAMSKSDWKIHLAGNGDPSFNPSLTASAQPLLGLSCLPGTAGLSVLEQE